MWIIILNRINKAVVTYLSVGQRVTQIQKERNRMLQHRYKHSLIVKQGPMCSLVKLLRLLLLAENFRVNYLVVFFVAKTWFFFEKIFNLVKILTVTFIHSIDLFFPSMILKRPAR